MVIKNHPKMDQNKKSLKRINKLKILSHLTSHLLGFPVVLTNINGLPVQVKKILIDSFLKENLNDLNLSKTSLFVSFRKEVRICHVLGTLQYHDFDLLNMSTDSFEAFFEILQENILSTSQNLNDVVEKHRIFQIGIEKSNLEFLHQKTSMNNNIFSLIHATADQVIFIDSKIKASPLKNTEKINLIILDMESNVKNTLDLVSIRNLFSTAENEILPLNKDFLKFKKEALLEKENLLSNVKSATLSHNYQMVLLDAEIAKAFSKNMTIQKLYEKDVEFLSQEIKMLDSITLENITDFLKSVSRSKTQVPKLLNGENLSDYVIHFFEDKTNALKWFDSSIELFPILGDLLKSTCKSNLKDFIPNQFNNVIPLNKMGIELRFDFNTKEEYPPIYYPTDDGCLYEAFLPFENILKDSIQRGVFLEEIMEKKELLLTPIKKLITLNSKRLNLHCLNDIAFWTMVKKGKVKLDNKILNSDFTINSLKSQIQNIYENITLRNDKNSPIHVYYLKHLKKLNRKLETLIQNRIQLDADSKIKRLFWDDSLKKYNIKSDIKRVKISYDAGALKDRFSLISQINNNVILDWVRFCSRNAFPNADLDPDLFIKKAVSMVDSNSTFLQSLSPQEQKFIRRAWPIYLKKITIYAKNLNSFKFYI